ncbi:hypothetical protein CNMCM5623_002334 [Aspergillus felis]|uniref:Uncharacterized protein n=1 Tax=Aspergillus felis TaxID=1287682 RepID=A0A8H6Q9I0_9EURO|nr:hypothetical protein CNMCM5623_002334 [Aspergillus felis]KAF7182797.1 hypothetical protein CNMCM7691_002458 [Aspergillus felis]
MYLTQSEAYASFSGENQTHNLAADSDADTSHEAIVGVIYHAPVQKPSKKEAPGPAQAEVCFPLGAGRWTASATTGGGYRFQGRDDEGEYVLEWKRRGTGKKGRTRSTSFSSSSTDPAPGGDSIKFVLGIVDVKTRRGTRVASLTKRGFEVGCWERLPRDALRECMGLGLSSSTDESELSEGQFRTAVYTMVLTMGVWVASQEGWLS